MNLWNTDCLLASTKRISKKNDAHDETKMTILPSLLTFEGRSNKTDYYLSTLVHFQELEHKCKNTNQEKKCKNTNQERTQLETGGESEKWV